MQAVRPGKQRTRRSRPRRRPASYGGGGELTPRLSRCSPAPPADTATVLNTLVRPGFPEASFPSEGVFSRFFPGALALTYTHSIDHVTPLPYARLEGSCVQRQPSAGKPPSHAPCRRRGQHQHRVRSPRSFRLARRLADPHGRTAHLGRICRLAQQPADALRPQARPGRRRGHRHCRPGRAVPFAPALPGVVSCRAADRSGLARLGFRDQGRQSERSRRRPLAERAGRPPKLWRPADRCRFRHRDHVRRGRLQRVHISVASSVRASTCRSRLFTRPPPACRASVSAGRRR